MIESFARPVRRIPTFGKFALCVMLSPLGGCASFQGQPDPVINPRSTTAFDSQTLGGAFGRFYIAIMGAYNSPDDQDRCVATPSGHRCGLSKEAYRNYVIGAYLATADDRYSEFTRRLRVESRGASFALDVGALGASAGASLAHQTTANVLAAIAATLTGTRASLNREVYLEQTVPAMVGAMEAQRTRISAVILAGLQRPASEYPLETAMRDVQSYEAAASLDNAVQALTQDAARRVQAANDFAADVREYTGPPAEGVAAITGRIRARLLQLSRAHDTTTLGTMAHDLNIAVPEGTDADGIRYLIQAHMRGIQDVAGATTLAQKLGVSLGGQ